MGWLWQECVCVCVCVVHKNRLSWDPAWTHDADMNWQHVLWWQSVHQYTKTTPQHSWSQHSTSCICLAGRQSCVSAPSSAQIHWLRLQCSASQLKMKHHSGGWIHATVPLCGAQKEPHNQWFPCRGGEKYNFSFIWVHDLLLGCPVEVRVGFSLQLQFVP